MCASPAWWGFLNESDLIRFDSFVLCAKQWRLLTWRCPHLQGNGDTWWQHSWINYTKEPKSCLPIL